MKQVTIIQTPFTQDALTHLRDNKTDTATFRHCSDKLCYLLLSNSLDGRHTQSVQIRTPLEATSGEKINEDIVIVIILRAGLAMLQPAIELLPHAAVGFAGVARDEKTALPHEYYWKMPEISEKTTIIIADPMLATGGTGRHVIQKISEKKPKEIRYVSVISTKEGIDTIHAEFPETTIITSAVDPMLNKQKFIVPGLGDYGDRYFGIT